VIQILNSVSECRSWIARLIDEGGYVVSRIPLNEVDKWGYDSKRTIYHHETRKFFTIRGLDFKNQLAHHKHWQQPIVDQPEQGILGYAITHINDVPHYLIQAKLEPGNPGLLQISPTLQATRSNLTRVHSGNSPKYMKFFVESDPKLVRELVSVPLSETASRFLGKKNFNTVVDLIDPIYCHVDVFSLVPSNVMKELLFIDNLVNMNARSILSLLMGGYGSHYSADALIKWLNDLRKKYPSTQTVISLADLSGWSISTKGMSCTYRNEFKVIGIQTEAKEREVPAWTQPILFHDGVGMCGLLVKEIGGIDQYLVQAKPEAGGSEGLELAPTVSCWDFSNCYEGLANIPFAEFFSDSSVMEFAVRHSEEGGRFDHFINDYCLRRIECSVEKVPENFRWVTFNELKAANIVPGVICSELRTLVALIGARI